MSAQQNTTPDFAAFPRDYAGLCGLLTLRVIHNAADYANVAEIADAMAVHAEDFTPDQEDYFDTLCTLIEAWDRAHVKWPRLDGLTLLRHLVESHGLIGAELSRLLGGSRQLGPMILRGERAITAAHARKLGARFNLDPGAFIA